MRPWSYTIDESRGIICKAIQILPKEVIINDTKREIFVGQAMKGKFLKLSPNERRPMTWYSDHDLTRIKIGLYDAEKYDYDFSGAVDISKISYNEFIIHKFEPKPQILGFF